MHPAYHLRRCCCGSTPCIACLAHGSPGDPDYLPRLECTARTGVTATVAGVVLQAGFQGSTGFVNVTWSGGNTIAGTYCLYASECGTYFVSLAPVKAGVIDAPETPADGRAVDLYLAIPFVCGGPAGSVNPEEPPGPDNGGSYAGAKIAGVAYDTADEPVILVAFNSAGEDGGTPTFIAWDRTCDVAGSVFANGIENHDSSANGGEEYTVGKDGTVTTGADCTNAPCGTACVTTGGVLTFTGGPLDGVSLDADASEPGACDFIFDDGRYHGSILPATEVRADQIILPAYELTVRDRDSSDNVVFVGRLVCDGGVDPAFGTYVADIEDAGVTAVFA